MAYQDEDLHDQLMRAFKEYFIANQDWIGNGTVAAGKKVRYWLNIIRHLCDDRRASIMDWRYEVIAIKAARREKRQASLDPEVEARRRAHLKKASEAARLKRLEKKNQNQTGTGTPSDT